MSHLTKIASAALIALVLAGGISTAAMAAEHGCTVYNSCLPPPPPPPRLQGDVESAYKRGSFDITEAELAGSAGAASKVVRESA